MLTSSTASALRRTSGARPARRARRASATFLAGLAGLAGLALLADGLGSCSCREGGGVELPGSLDLLARSPDTVIEQPGVLVADATSEFGPWAIAGWRRTDWREFEINKTRAHGENRAVTQHATATLNLLAGRPRDREVRVRVACPRPEDGSPGTFSLSLNDRVLAQGLPLSPELTDVTVEAPAPLWHEGENVLAISTPVHGGVWDTLHVARVEYDVERRVTRDDATGALTLPAYSGLRYRIETRPGTLIEIEGASTGAGTLHVTTGALDPASGEVTRSGFPAPEVAAKNGRVATRVPVTALVAEQVLDLELLWNAEDESELSLTRVVVREPEEVPRPPVLFFSIDTFAGRHASVNGYGRDTTPELRELAQDGIVFERCVANAPWTTPSYLSVLTGLYPRAHQVLDVRSKPGQRLENHDFLQIADNRWTLAEMLRARGYRTAGFVDTLWLTDKFNFDQGFDEYSYAAADLSLPLSDPTGGIWIIARQFSNFFDALPADTPFFLFGHALDAHGPYYPERPFLGTFQTPPDGHVVAGGSMHQTYRTMPTWMAITLTPERELPADIPVAEVLDRYDDALLKTDSYLGEIFDDLRRRGLYDDTLIIVSGDHGESFAHDFYSHGCMWEDIVHVPLVVKLPGNRHAGTRVAQSVQLVDVYPTIEELVLGRPARSDLHGRSLLPLIRGERPAPVPTFSEGGHVEQYMVESEGWKLVEVWPGSTGADHTLLTHPRVPDRWLEQNFPELLREPLTERLMEELKVRPAYRERIAELHGLVRGPYYELYDLATDPRELRDLHAERPEVVARLRTLLAEHKALGRQAQERARPDLAVKPFTADQVEELRKLGYAGADEVDAARGKQASPRDGLSDG